MAGFGPLIDVTTLNRLLDAPDVVVLDCRFDLKDPGAGRRSYLEGHIPGARYVDLDADLAATPSSSSGRHPLPEPGEAARRFGALGVGDDSRVVAYDEGPGAIAARAWWMLAWLGHERVALLDGGFRAWTESGLPVESGPVEAAPETLTARSGDVDIVTTEDIVKEIGGHGSLRLVDARDRRRFRGEVEPIDPVAGHIPGAVNLPFSRLVGEDGRLRPAAEIAALFGKALDGATEAPWSVMCGSGVTACHLAIGAELAGLRRPGVYVGSWSEWIRDPERPVATGE